MIDTSKMTQAQKATFLTLHNDATIIDSIAHKLNGHVTCLTYSGDDVDIAPDGTCTIDFPEIGPLGVIITE
jgi:hypothetical protein